MENFSLSGQATFCQSLVMQSKKVDLIVHNLELFAVAAPNTVCKRHFTVVIQYYRGERESRRWIEVFADDAYNSIMEFFKKK